jgi:hypothetical protein
MRSLSEPGDALASYGLFAGRSEVEYNAACLWFGHWLDQHEHGTAASRAADYLNNEAARVIRNVTGPISMPQRLPSSMSP